MECQTNYVFLHDNDQITCIDKNTIDNTKYSNDNTNYYLCSYYLSHCHKCEKNGTIFTCLECQTNYVFLHDNDQITCIDKNTIDNTKYSIDNINFYPCNNRLYNDIDNCATCIKKEECTGCYSDYTLVNDKQKCILTSDINNKKYYKDINNHYYLCLHSLAHCNKCDSALKCTECDNDYDLEESDICIPNTSIIAQLYYLDDITSKYISCSKILNCEKCLSSTECISCQSNYYFEEGDNNEITCQNIDINKYYEKTDNGKTFYRKCEKDMTNCEYCTNSNYCTKCKENFILDDNNNCVVGTILYNNDNKTVNCSLIIENCLTCNLENECISCQEGFVIKNKTCQKYIKKKKKLNDDDNKLSTGKILAITFGTLAALYIIIVLIYFLKKKLFSQKNVEISLSGKNIANTGNYKRQNEVVIYSTKRKIKN